MTRARRIWTSVKSWTVDPLIWLGALTGYVVIDGIVHIINWCRRKR